MSVYILHPESFRSNAQNANAFACRKRPCVERNDEFACVYLRLRAFYLRSRAFACVRLRDRMRAYARTYVYRFVFFVFLFF